MTTSHEQLAQMWAANKFEPQIHHIRFPRFRNLADGLEIKFRHPLTAIVGANGANKSSILRALQGCPDYENIGKYWFGTALDAIEPDERHRFIHGRWSESERTVVEVLKTRIQRKSGDTQDPDYFEPSRPIVGDGMATMPPLGGTSVPLDRTLTRWKAIDKEVVYVDFRAEISAFDKYFHHHDYKSRRADPQRREALASRKALIRERSVRVRRLFDRRSRSYKPGGKEWVVEPARHLRDDELKAVSAILGREYTSIEVLAHRGFDVSGTTARLSTSDFNYSEAWAGSGEFAAIQLVTAVLNADERSLILLDEPEVSLHPGAQRRLMAFLMDQCKAKRHQIVLATHSPTLIESLPDAAIKVLQVDAVTNRVNLRSQNSLPETAFATIEHRFSQKTIVVEDTLAAEIVRAALRRDGAVHLSSVDVKAMPGGVGYLRSKALPGSALEGRNDLLLLLDGDASPLTIIRSSNTVPPSELDDEVCTLLGVASLSGHVPMNSSGLTESDLRKILAWAEDYVRYLPGMTPEAWLISAAGLSTAVSNPKLWWCSRAREELGKLPVEPVTALEILECQKRHLAALPDSEPDLTRVRNDIDQFLRVGR